ncbi:complex I NDUFA9 subunit family protein [Natronobacterium gregoryi]|uniref:Complex I NDUFA9 subunit family protein n=2 Tax=Natronobacterium gregoryi TaxID=44930 RepID=L0AJ46_NATGS|nr:complex I NDUFA9 subunit family protein [Natronobacterium gregoryi]AFZ73826.1 putative nucleoside-diphosphate sugar epimerase [Natronobacterium gregoryi SP2]ELY65073.1 NAD-dependent epimerase/dehydratase [Natronobacterium gregoryi SP2]PLK19716.1 complex I NDUFA9 subunit family protein [Natronobacterium gregoryi SP2]SFJ41923.1 NADH dehydrogenase [Natronobacterium gregoryi]
MNVFVAGGAGFIGTNLCTELVERGHDVTALSRTPGRGSIPEEVDLAVGDVSAYDSIEDAVAGHDAVVNLVSLAPLWEPKGDRDHETVHVGGTENLVRAAETHDVERFLQMSALGANPDGDTAYIRAKGRAEEVVRDSSLEWTIFRPSVVFGDGGEFVAFTKTLTTPYVTGLPGGGETRFQPIWVGDLVPMLADVFEDDDHVGGTYEVGGPQVVTLADVTELVYEADGKSVTVLPIPMLLAKLGLAVAEPLPFVPFGSDQARSLEFDNTITDNDVTAFGRDVDGLTTLRAYLETDATELE